MHALELRSTPPAKFRRSPKPATVEELVDRIADLVLERQDLRRRDAGAETLERNRARLVRAHWDLSHALIDRHCPPKTAEAAA